MLAAFAYQFQPQIICITETWYREADKIDALLSISGNYDTYRKDRSGGSRGGGVCALVKRDSHVFRNAHQIASDSLSQNLEYLIIQIDINFTTTNLVLIYRSPTADITSLQNFLQILTPLASQPIFILGDLNFPQIDWKNSSSAKLDPCSELFKTFTQDFDLTQLVSEPTRVRGSSSTILDLVLTNQPNFINSCQVGAPLGPTCDHNSVRLEFRFPKCKPIPRLNRLAFTQGNYHLANALIASLNWNALLGQVYDINVLYSKFQSAILSIIGFTIPFQPENQERNRYPPHISSLLSKVSSQKYTSSEESISNRLKQLKSLKRSIVQFQQKREDKISLGNNKQFFSYVLKKLKSEQGIGPIKSNGSVVTDDTSKSNLFADYFASVYKMDPNPIPKSENGHLDYIEVSYFDVLELLLKLPNRVSTSPDSIPSIFLKQTANTIAKPLTLIYRRVMLQGTIPSIWKTATVTPIFKKGDKTLVQNYRPISLTCITSKILERIVHKRLSFFLSRGGILSRNQHGFMQNRSTMSALLEYTSDCALALEKGSSLSACFFDFQKAYDSVSHSKLLFKLKQIGISGSLYKFFASFLLERTFQVRIGSSISTPQKATSGVPQGSVLAPLLFNVFLNDIFKCLPNDVKSNAYADDLRLWTINNPAALQTGIELVYTWSEEWELPINQSKTQIHFVGKPLTFPFAINGRPIEIATAIRDLGIFYDSKLSFQKHVDQKYASAMSIINLIFRAFSTRKISTYLRLYKTFVLPILEYLSPLWSPSEKASIQKLESIQRKFTKRLFYRTGLPKIPYESRLVKLSLNSLSERRLVTDLVTFYKIIHGQIETAKPLFLGAPSIGRTRGHCKRVQFIAFRKQKPFTMFHCRVPKIWNKLPGNIVMAKNPKVFREEVLKHLASVDTDRSPYLRKG